MPDAFVSLHAIWQVSLGSGLTKVKAGFLPGSLPRLFRALTGLRTRPKHNSCIPAARWLMRLGKAGKAAEPGARVQPGIN
ncbi:hypothetical protein KU6B_31060 [Mameliella alba]|nr:hypothetical protein KU6B_31060 [Mameliella alba]